MRMNVEEIVKRALSVCEKPCKALGCSCDGVFEMISLVPFEGAGNRLCLQMVMNGADGVSDLGQEGMCCPFLLRAETEVDGVGTQCMGCDEIVKAGKPDRWRCGGNACKAIKKIG